MKIRWNRNSVRLRITPSELAALQRGESVGESLTFPGGAGWRIQVSIGGTSPALWHDGNAAQLRLSPADLLALSAPEREGVYFQSDDTAFPLAYYVEKDFPCVHPRAEEVQALSAVGGISEETFPAPTNFGEQKMAE